MNQQIKGFDRRESLRRGVYVLPNLFTTGSLIAGFYSIIQTMNTNFQVAAWFVLIASIFDGLDGKVARLTGTTSRFGVEYDSLADLVAFGVAPGVLMYAWALKPFGKLGWLAAFLFVVCGALRLARFNVQVNTVESKRFVGLPIPAAACMVSITVLLFYHLGYTGELERRISVLVLIYVLAFLMVSNVSFYSFKDPDLFKRQPFGFLVGGIILLIVIIAQPQVMLFALMLSYICIGTGAYLLRLLRLRKRTAKDDSSQAKPVQPD
ncbi:MAG: CDP-diacylglycerol--serine O-phosphatidyltransferase [Desulfuromonas sp.]|nr:MAG: CDP-diacylglycerol--serine O-phosphatidyltransferase [Desulfuromonas sp.]